MEKKQLLVSWVGRRVGENGPFTVIVSYTNLSIDKSIRTKLDPVVYLSAHTHLVRLYANVNVCTFRTFHTACVWIVWALSYRFHFLAFHSTDGFFNL